MEALNPKLVNENEKGKTCTRCYIFKPLFDFGKASSGKDGHRTYCKICHSKKKREWYDNNKEYVLNKTKQYQDAHPEIAKQAKKKWADNNKEQITAYRKKYRKENIEKRRAHVSARRKKLRQNTPKWADMVSIRLFYLNCPKGYHVDHVIPIKGKLVSGLHILENLQYLPAKVNMSKHNKWEIE